MLVIDQKQQFIIHANYELFVLLIILLSVVNGIIWLFPLEPFARSVIQIIEYGISAFLLADFFARLLSAQRKRTYLIDHYGWLDLLGSLPLFGLRLARLAKYFILGRKLRRADLTEMGVVVVERRAASTLLLVIFLAIVIFEVSGIAILQAELQNPAANIRTASDALWWAYVTVATVGYGDYYPVTIRGRVVGAFLMTAGVGLFSVITSYLADWFRRPRQSGSQRSVPPSMPGSTDPSVELDEIQRLLAEHQLQHQRAMDELRDRLDQVKKSLSG